MARLHTGFNAWNTTPLAQRAAVLRRAADALDARLPEFCGLLVKEAHKTLGDCVAEVREAVDFCRYYADQAEARLATQVLPGPTGESNELHLHGRGVFVCISPWNFPLAIFAGQVVAALVAGNAVAAKPAEQTPAVAQRFVELLFAAGVPNDALALLHGPGETVGAALVADPRTAGVCFTGSTAVAKIINRTLAAKDGAMVPLIAETGGINAMIVDSTALPEQVVDAVVQSAFRSAGQRCSALRLLCVHEGVADGVIEMIRGALKELNVGDPALLATDVGPGHRRRSLRGHRCAHHAAAVAGHADRRNTGHVHLPAPDRADRVRAEEHRRREAGDLRPGAARRALGRRCRFGHHPDQRARLRPDARHPDPHRLARLAPGGGGAHRQRLRQPQHDRRGGRRAAFRWRRPVRHRPESRRPALPVPLLRRADGDDQHRRGRRQRGLARRPALIHEHASYTHAMDNIVFIGGGNMASAIVGGLVKSGRAAASILVVDPGEAQRSKLTGDFGVRTLAAADATLAGAALVVWAVKPQLFGAAAAPCAPFVGQALHLSVMAGIRSDAIVKATGAARIVRSMPNTPALIGEGIAGLYASGAVTAADRAEVEAVLAPTGQTLWVAKEQDLDAVTALSGSGPAYVFYFVEAMMQAARDMGLSEAQGKQLALATFAGATSLARASSEPPEVLRERVTSKGGTTYAALMSLEASGVKPAIVQALRAAQQRARELGDEFGR